MKEWQILRAVGGTTVVVGYVWASDEVAAVRLAAEKFGLSDQDQTLEATLVNSP